MGIDRRALLVGAAVASSVRAAAPRAAQPRQVTPEQTTGPFYPVVDPTESFGDLSQNRATAKRAAGRLIEIEGRVLLPNGQPVGSAMVLVWHASAAGRYPHPRDSQAIPLDPGFPGHALVRTTPDGRFRLLTIKPGAYADGSGNGGMRTPHVHFEIIGESGRLITQMYFPDEALNAQDMLINELRAKGQDPALVTAAARSASATPGAVGYGWDIVLNRA